MKVEKLKQSIKGDVMEEKYLREMYSVDASIYKMVPKMVVAPKDKEDVRKVVEFAKNEGLGITCRSGGTSLAGAGVGSGILLDFAKYMHQIGQVVEEGGKKFVKVQPGVIYKRLNDELAKKKLFLPPTPASAVACMIGGNVGTKASGMRGVKYGTMDAFVENVEFVDNQARLQNSQESKDNQEIKEKLEQLQKELKQDQESSQKLIQRKAFQTTSGYNIFALQDAQRLEDALTHLFVGSVGTLGVMTEFKLRVEPLKEAQRCSAAIFLKNLNDIEEFVAQVKKMGCSGVEFVERASLAMAEKKFTEIKIPQETSVMMLVEFDEDVEKKMKELRQLAGNFQLASGQEPACSSMVIESEDKPKMDLFWKIRRALLPLCATFSHQTKPITSADDIGVPINYLADILQDLRKIFDDLGIPCALYGHPGVGCVHIDPVLEVTTAEKLPLIQKIAELVYAATFKYGGTMATEHAMGRSRAPFLEAEWGPAIYQYFKKIKQIFDPADIFNPGVFFVSPQKKITENIRFPEKFLDEKEWPCIDCRYCLSGCPAWTKDRMMSPPNFKNLTRYYLETIKGTVPGQAGDSPLEAIKKQMLKCILCGNCTRVCPNGADIKGFNGKWRKEWE